MASERELFRDFDRMRREMDELFGDAAPRRVGGGRGSGFSPAVDVYYCGEPPTAVVVADLAGIDPGGVTLEIRGRDLVLAGSRGAPRDDGRRYQQLEIPFGPFQRVVALGADVVADRASAKYEDGFLRVTLPLRRPVARTVKIAGREGEAPA
jgi:HSP20 family protein